MSLSHTIGVYLEMHKTVTDKAVVDKQPPVGGTPQGVAYQQPAGCISQLLWSEHLFVP